MKKIILLLFVGISMYAQKTECSYSMLLLKVHQTADMNTIMNLNVTLFEKKGNGKIKATPWFLEYYPNNYGCYTVNLPNDFNMKNMYLHIQSVCEDVDGIPKTYGQLDIKLYANDKISSCLVEQAFRQNISDFIINDEQRVFYPIEVVMDLKDCNEEE